MTQAVTKPEEEYLAHLEAGRFMLLQPKGGAPFFFPRTLAPGTGETDLEWVPASGRGTVYSTTVVRKRDSSTNVALIDLAEGPRMMSRVTGIAPDAVTIGMKVRARIDRSGNAPIVVFEPEE